MNTIELDKSKLSSIQESIADALEIDKDDIAIEKKVSDFSNWDSLGYVKVIISLSEKFTGDIDPATLVECKTIKDIYEYIISI